VSFEVVVQQIIYDKLKSDLPYSVFDDVPQSDDSSAFPYVTIGEDALTSSDTDTELMQRASITIHTWTRERGRRQCKLIQGEIYNSLNRANLTAAGYKFITITGEDSISFYDPDGFTRHGVQTFNLLIEEV
jgi:hypothetical protein